MRGSSAEQRGARGRGRRGVLHEGVVVAQAGVPDLEEHVPGDPVPVRARGRQAAVQVVQPGVVEPLGRLGERDRPEGQVGHREPRRGDGRLWGEAGARSNDVWGVQLTPVAMGNKVVGVLLDNHSQLVFSGKALCAPCRRSPPPSSRSARSPSAISPSPLAAAQDGAGRGAHHHRRLRRGALPQPHGSRHARERERRPLRRCSSPTASTTSSRSARELEVEDAQDRGRRGQAAKSRWSSSTWTTRSRPAATLRAGLRAAAHRHHQRNPRAPDLQRRRSPAVRQRRHPDHLARHRRRPRRADPRHLGPQLPGLPAERARGQRLLRRRRASARAGRRGRTPASPIPSLTGRLEWARPGLRIGGSFWYGGSASAGPAARHRARSTTPSRSCPPTRGTTSGPLCSGAWWRTSASPTPRQINAAYGGQVGSRIAGGYVEGAYNVLSALAPASTQRLNAFLRYERYNTQAGVPDGVVRDDALARRITTVGLSTSRCTTWSSRATTSFAGTRPAWARTSSSPWGWGISSRRHGTEGGVAASGLCGRARARRRPGGGPVRAAGQARQVARARLRRRRAGGHPARGHGHRLPRLARRRAARLRAGAEREGQGAADHLPRGHRFGGRRCATSTSWPIASRTGARWPTTRGASSSAARPPPRPLQVGKDIKNISGATISSNAVTRGVRQALAELTAWHAAGKAQVTAEPGPTWRQASPVAPGPRPLGHHRPAGGLHHRRCSSSTTPPA